MHRITKRAGGPGKTPSFETENTTHVNVRLPFDLVRDFKVVVAKKGGRLNQEVAAALRLYIKQQNGVRTSSGA